MPRFRWGAWLVAMLLAPVAVSGQAAEERLSSELSRMLETYRWPDAHWGVQVVSLDQGDTLFAVDADAALAPASNAKLLTTAAALKRLGPDFRFVTFLLSDAPVRDGTLSGDLTLYGTGDPAISDRFYRNRNDVFEALVDQLEAAGVRVVAGDLVADASHLPGPLRPEGWDPADLNDAFAGAVSALSFNENVASFRIVPARSGGVRPEVLTIPEVTGMEVVNSALTVTGAARPRVAILRDDPLDPIRVEGHIARGSGDVWRQMTVPDPAHFAASAFRAVLAERGIVVRGRIRTVTTPAASVVKSLTAPMSPDRPRTRVLARHTSPPLIDLLAIVNKRSNNLYAELVFRTLGRSRSGHGDAAASAAAVRESLEELGVPMADVVLVDGSGLSAANRVPASTFVSLVEGMSRDPHWESYWATLPEAGQRQGLGRMYRTAAAGNLRAKTGTIEGVSALSGLVRSRDQERLAFSIILNGTPSTTRAKRIENQIGARLAEFSRGAGTSVVAGVTSTDVADVGGPRYQVRRGDNLSGIAQRHGVSIEAILGANPHVDRNRIEAGEWLAMPLRPGGG